MWTNLWGAIQQLSWFEKGLYALACLLVVCIVITVVESVWRGVK